MKPKALISAMLVSALYSAGASAQVPTAPEPTDRPSSPYDRNPACMDRNVASTDPACVIQDGPPAVRPYGFDLNRPRPVAPLQPAQPAGAPPLVIVVPPTGGTPQ